MIGFEYILETFKSNPNQLSEELGIKRQSVYEWIKKGKVPQTRLKQLSERFNVHEDYFNKELSESEKLEIQKAKFSEDLKPIITRYEVNLSFEEKDLIEYPIYDNDVMNKIELDIKKAKIIEEFNNLVKQENEDFSLLMFQQLNKLLEFGIKSPIIANTLDGLSYYYEVLPDWVGNPEAEEFIQELLNLFAKYENDLQ